MGWRDGGAWSVGGGGVLERRRGTVLEGKEVGWRGRRSASNGPMYGGPLLCGRHCIKQSTTLWKRHMVKLCSTHSMILCGWHTVTLCTPP